MSVHQFDANAEFRAHSGPLHARSDAGVLVRRLHSLYPMRTHEIQAIETMLGSAYSVPSYHVIVQDRQRPSEALVLLEGMACRYRVLDTARRQMTGLVVPGDFCDYSFLSSSPAGHCVMSLGNAVVGRIDLDHLAAIADKLPNIVVAAMRAAAMDAASSREMVISLGARDAIQRLAHLLCELHFRLFTVGMVNPNAQFELPMTQAEIGEALGLSTVHVNRTIQQLRRRKLIAMAQGSVTILDMAGLAATAAFDSTYLQAN